MAVDHLLRHRRRSHDGDDTASGPIAEGSPLVGRAVAAYGVRGLVGLKLVAFAVAYGVWRSVGHPHNVGVPLTLSVLGVGLTTWNPVVISVELFD